MISLKSFYQVVQILILLVTKPQTLDIFVTPIQTLSKIVLQRCQPWEVKPHQSPHICGSLQPHNRYQYYKLQKNILLVLCDTDVVCFMILRNKVEDISLQLVTLYIIPKYSTWIYNSLSVLPKSQTAHKTFYKVFKKIKFQNSLFA